MNKYIGLFVFCIYSILPLAHAQGLNDQWKSLNQEVMMLRESGEYGHAILASRKAISMAREAYQSTNKKSYSTELRASLHHLASIYKAQENYAETISVYQEMLKIWEEIAGSSHPDKATMKNLADAYRTQGRYSEAEFLYLKLLAAIIDESKFVGPLYDNFVISIYKSLSALYWITERNSEAEAMDRYANQIKSKRN